MIVQTDNLLPCMEQKMTDRVWNKLCENIHEGKCILMLGSEFPVEYNKKGRVAPTSFNKLLFEKIASDVLEAPRTPQDYEQTLTQKELSQLARDYIIYSDQKLADARNDLKQLVAKYLLEEVGDNLESQCFSLLAAMPFYFIVNTNYCDFFYSHLAKAGKKPRNHFYNFQGPQVDVSGGGAGGVKIGTSNEPLVFNLYGSVHEPASIAISDYDLVQLLCKIIAKDPALPADVRTELTNEQTSFLFLGFGILAKNWYFRILLHALTAGNRYYWADGGAPAGNALTLIAEEELAAFNEETGIELTAQASRRNVLTRGIDLNELVGKRFRVGEVECEGVELCEPCSHLASLTHPGVLRGMVHRAGLNADILTDGKIAVGDPVIET